MDSIELRLKQKYNHVELFFDDLLFYKVGNLKYGMVQYNKYKNDFDKILELEYDEIIFYRPHRKCEANMILFKADLAMFYYENHNTKKWEYEALTFNDYYEEHLNCHLVLINSKNKLFDIELDRKFHHGFRYLMIKNIPTSLSDYWNNLHKSHKPILNPPVGEVCISQFNISHLTISITTLETLKIGTDLILEKESHPLFKDLISIYLKDGTKIGYAASFYYNKITFLLQNKISLKCRVSNILLFAENYRKVRCLISASKSDYEKIITDNEYELIEEIDKNYFLIRKDFNFGLMDVYEKVISEYPVMHKIAIGPIIFIGQCHDLFSYHIFKNGLHTWGHLKCIYENSRIIILKSKEGHLFSYYDYRIEYIGNYAVYNIIISENENFQDVYLVTHKFNEEEYSAIDIDYFLNNDIKLTSDGFTIKKRTDLGVINQLGKIILPLQYSVIELCDNDLKIRCSREDNIEILDLRVGKLKKLEYSEFNSKFE